MKNQGFWCIIARVSAAIFRQAELPFSEEDKVQMLRDDNRHLRDRIIALEEEIERMRRMLFGSSSEKMEKGEWMVTVEEKPLPEEPKEEPKAATETGKKAEGETERKPRLKVHVTRRVWHELLPEEVKAEPEKYQRLPKSCDVVSRRIEKVPAHLREEIYVCPRFVRRGGAGKKAAPIHAKAPGTILPGSSMGTSVLAMAIHGKYVLHLPLYRQIKEFERLGIEGLSEGVMCNWMRASADSMEGMWMAMHGQLLESPALHVDETPVRCLKASVTKGTMWVLTAAEDGMSFYYWRTSRGRHVLDELLREGMNPEGAVYGGTIISDGYEGYASWMRSLPEEQRPQWQACWAHVRRKFVEAARTGNDPEWSRQMVELITPLYRIERELRESKAPPETIAEKREAESRPIVEAFFEALQKRMKQSENPPVNTLRRAIVYALERRETLMTWLKAPQIPIDNNAVERAIRPLAVGRRNSLFIGSPEAGKRAAILYTMVRECQRVKVDVEAWLTEVLRRLPGYRGDYIDLLPGMLELPESGGSATSVKA